MAKIAGRRGALYVDLSGSGSASPVPYLKKYTFSSKVGTIDVTSFGDTTKTYVADLPDAQGTFDDERASEARCDAHGNSFVLSTVTVASARRSSTPRGRRA